MMYVQHPRTQNCDVRPASDKTLLYPRWTRTMIYVLQQDSDLRPATDETLRFMKCILINTDPDFCPGTQQDVTNL